MKIDISIVRYKGTHSESGAYIFAPTSDAVPINLKQIDGYFIDSKISS